VSLRTCAPAVPLRMAVCALLGATVLAALTAAPPARAAKTKRCGHASVGFAEASVKARNLSCRKARRFVFKWARAGFACYESNNFCEVTHFHRFRCVKGGGEGLVKLYCRRGSQRIKGVWGD
jgi:hypothetical protein